MENVGLEKRLQDLQSYFEQGCIVYAHCSSETAKMETMLEIDRTLDEANSIRKRLGNLVLS